MTQVTVPTADVREKPAHGTHPALSVIVPLAPGEMAWHELVGQLVGLPANSELILVKADTQALNPPSSWPADIEWRTRTAPPGRARQLNVGAQAARGHWLWFLHADSILDTRVIPELIRFVAAQTDAVGYFKLAFADDGPRLAALNAWGANLRSRWLHLPFGDQALLMPAHCFHHFGGFDERTAYGEDHLLVWSARAAGMPLVGLQATVRTSARKFARQGWLRTTWRHWHLTLAQAWPAWRRSRRPSP